MATGNAYITQYRKTAISGASPLQLIVMLYDGSLRFMEAAKRAMQQGDLYAQNENIQRTQKIVAELLSCLDMEKGGEVAQNLFALYTWVYNRLIEANVEDSVEMVGDCIQVMSDLRESWAKLEEQQREGRAAVEVDSDYRQVA